MTSLRIVEVVDVLPDRLSGDGAGGVGCGFDQLRFDRGEEALRDGAVRSTRSSVCNDGLTVITRAQSFM